MRPLRGRLRCHPTDAYAPTNPPRVLRSHFLAIKKRPARVVDLLCMAERVGFEPTHGLRRLADFESAPLGLLGTFPRPKRDKSYNTI